MGGQGNTILRVAERLTGAGWQLAYTCVPNTPHIGAVAIPTARGTSRQRYPDVVAAKLNTVVLVEVEISLSESVVDDITERFREMRSSLADRQVYRAWSDAVRRECDLSLPAQPKIVCALVACRPFTQKSGSLLQRLADERIAVVAESQFNPAAFEDSP